jgi:RNA polymerase sigma factor (sigma-70 family)
MNKNAKIQAFLDKYKEALEQPILKGFLKDAANYNRLIQYILNPNEENKLKLETAFKAHYETVRNIKYYSNLIKFFSIDYDKKVRRLNKRFLLTLDQPSGNDDQSTLKDLVADEQSQEPLMNHVSLHSLIENEKLHEALDVLTDKQVLILELIYVKDLSNVEVAKIINSSPQNVSNIHKKALKKLRQAIQ